MEYDHTRHLPIFPIKNNGKAIAQKFSLSEHYIKLVISLYHSSQLKILTRVMISASLYH